MKKVQEQARGGKKEKRALVRNDAGANQSSASGMVTMTIRLPEVLAERIHCAAAWNEKPTDVYLADIIDDMVRCDEESAGNELLEVARGSYFDKAGLPVDHLFRRICLCHDALHIEDFERLAEFSEFHK